MGAIIRRFLRHFGGKGESELAGSMKKGDYYSILEARNEVRKCLREEIRLNIEAPDLEHHILETLQKEGMLTYLVADYNAINLFIKQVKGVAEGEKRKRLWNPKLVVFLANNALRGTPFPWKEKKE